MQTMDGCWLGSIFFLQTDRWMNAWGQFDLQTSGCMLGSLFSQTHGCYVRFRLGVSRVRPLD